MDVHQCTELISRPVPATKTGQAPSRQYRATPTVLNILAVYLVSYVADPSFTSEGPAMSTVSGLSCGESIYLWLTLEQERNGIAFRTSHKYETSITTERPLSQHSAS